VLNQINVAPVLSRLADWWQAQHGLWHWRHFKYQTERQFALVVPAQRDLETGVSVDITFWDARCGDKLRRLQSAFARHGAIPKRDAHADPSFQIALSWYDQRELPFGLILKCRQCQSPCWACHQSANRDNNGRHG